MLSYKIAALLVSRHLTLNKLLDTPINRGASFWVAYIVYMKFYDCLESVEDEFIRNMRPQDDGSFWLEVYKEIARECELSDLFLSPLNIDILIKCILHSLFISGTESIQYEKPSVSEIQSWINIGTDFHYGKCMHYAALGLYYLLEAKAGPITSIWLYEKRDAGLGHNILVLGLNEDDFSHLADTDALIVDYWSGIFIDAKDAFKEGGPFAHLNPESFVIYYHHVQGAHPFRLTLPEPDFQNKLDHASSIAHQMQAIFEERVKSGERIIPIMSHYNQNLNPTEAKSLIDLSDHERQSNFDCQLQLLHKYETSARKIQRAWRFFSSKKTLPQSTPDIEQEVSLEGGVKRSS